MTQGKPTALSMKLGMTDAKLCQILLDKGSLTDLQLADIVAAAARVADGGRLGKNERDRLMNIAMAQKLTHGTRIRSRSNGATANIMGDMYSTSRTRGTEIAEVILARGRTPSGGMIAPPGRRRTG